MEKELVKPTVHKNGTSARELMNGYREAYLVLGKALEVLVKCYPNGRDYYVQGEKVIFQAQDQYFAWIKGVEKVRLEVLALFLHVEKQKPV